MLKLELDILYKWCYVFFVVLAITTLLRIVAPFIFLYSLGFLVFPLTLKNRILKLLYPFFVVSFFAFSFALLFWPTWCISLLTMLSHNGIQGILIFLLFRGDPPSPPRKSKYQQVSKEQLKWLPQAI